MELTQREVDISVGFAVDLAKVVAMNQVDSTIEFTIRQESNGFMVIPVKYSTSTVDGAFRRWVDLWQGKFRT